MKILAPFEKLFTPYALIALNLAIILSAEFVGGGTYFAETGLAHGIAIVCRPDYSKNFFRLCVQRLYFARVFANPARVLFVFGASACVRVFRA